MGINFRDNSCFNRPGDFRVKHHADSLQGQVRFGVGDQDPLAINYGKRHFFTQLREPGDNSIQVLQADIADKNLIPNHHTQGNGRFTGNDRNKGVGPVNLVWSQLAGKYFMRREIDRKIIGFLLFQLVGDAEINDLAGLVEKIDRLEHIGAADLPFQVIIEPVAGKDSLLVKDFTCLPQGSYRALQKLLRIGSDFTGQELVVPGDLFEQVIPDIVQGKKGKNDQWQYRRKDKIEQ